MSEFINNSELRIKELQNFILGITTQSEKGIVLVKKHEDVIEAVHPYDVMVAIDHLMKENLELPTIKTGVNRSLNMLYKAINAHQIPDYSQKPFFHYLNMENNGVHRHLSNLRPFIKTINEKTASKAEIDNALGEIKARINKLKAFNLHYIKVENILFPYIEKHFNESGCLPLMWSYHDDIRNNIQKILNLLDVKTLDLKSLNSLLGDLFFPIYAMRFREEHILFPVIFDLIPDGEIIEMEEQSFEVGFAFISPPSPKPHKNEKTEDAVSNKNMEFFSLDDMGDKLLDFGTGKLSIKQAMMILNHLPVDMTFVDEKDEVRYYSDPDHRIFPRTKAIIGRSVENCHPPSSVHVVKELIEAFRSGKNDKESFWIQSGDKLILIQYFALRDKSKNYCGTLEVSQEITEIRKLKGEKRLMGPPENFKKQ